MSQQILRISRQFSETHDLIRNSKNHATRLRRIEFARKLLAEIKEFQNRGISFGVDYAATLVDLAKIEREIISKSRPSVSVEMIDEKDSLHDRKGVVAEIKIDVESNGNKTPL